MGVWVERVRQPGAAAGWERPLAGFCGWARDTLCWWHRLAWSGAQTEKQCNKRSRQGFGPNTYTCTFTFFLFHFVFMGSMALIIVIIVRANSASASALLVIDTFIYTKEIRRFMYSYHTFGLCVAVYSLVYLSQYQSLCMVARWVFKCEFLLRRHTNVPWTLFLLADVNDRAVSFCGQTDCRSPTKAVRLMDEKALSVRQLEITFCLCVCVCVCMQVGGCD